MKNRQSFLFPSFVLMLISLIISGCSRLSSTNSIGETEIERVIVQIRELEREYQDYSQQLEEIEERRQEIFELGRIHDKTPERIAELVNKITTDKTLSEDETLAIVEQMRRLSLGANSKADELDEMVRETREERNAIWAQRESVHAELNSLKSLMPAEVSYEK